MKLLTAALSLAALALLPAAANAQLPLAPASPHATLTQQVGVANVTLDYSRPSVRGREIFGGMVAYGKVWRAGANASTKIGFDRDVRFGGEDVAAGTYALYVIPHAESWTLVLHTNTELWGAGNYDEAQDLLRVEVPVVTLNRPVESLTIDFQNFHFDGADLVIAWADTQASVPVEVPNDEAVMAEIRAKVIEASGPVSPQDYFSAGVYYHKTGRDLATAAGWIDNALAMQPQAFWMVLARAELAYDMGDLERARDGANLARKLAGQSPAGDFGYVAKSEQLLKRIDEG